MQAAAPPPVNSVFTISSLRWVYHKFALPVKDSLQARTLDRKIDERATCEELYGEAEWMRLHAGFDGAAALRRPWARPNIETYRFEL